MAEQNVWCGSDDCVRCTVRDSALFAGLEPEQLLQVKDCIEQYTLEPESTLYRMGDPADAAFTVRKGLVKLVQYLADGSLRIVRVAQSGDVIGLEALLGEPYGHDAIIVQSAELCRLPLDILNRLGRESPGLHQELMRRWQRALSEADAWLTELSTGPSRQRVVRLLLRLADAQGEGVGPLFSRKDMGAMLGITTESASRVIAELKRAGLLVENTHGFRCDRSGLARLLTE